ncbi:hypothetical protein FRC05_001895 [Tulasnella sp. 425]|nr:hypothetical protein FRC05_001895 [Tulasnella sp. 425]
MTFQEWLEAFEIATLWGFEQLRAYIIKTMDSIAQDPSERILVADQCGLTEWLYPAYAKLCARDASLTAEEGRRLGFERLAALSRIREDDLKATQGLRAAQSTSGLEGSVTSGVSVAEGKHHKKNVKRKQKEKAKKALEKAIKIGAGDGQAVGNVKEPSPPQVFGKPPELQPNCKKNCCKPRFSLSFKEQQFLAKVARAVELKID